MWDSGNYGRWPTDHNSVGAIYFATIPTIMAAIQHATPPDWFVEGERHWDLVTPAREEIASRERRRAYEASPKCYIDRDYARPLRRNLQEEISWLDDESTMTISFDGRVLSVDFCDRVHEVVASGDAWPSSYRVVVSPETKLPVRFTSSSVGVSVFDGHVRLARLPLGPSEVVS